MGPGAAFGFGQILQGERVGDWEPARIDPVDSLPSRSLNPGSPVT